MLSISRKASQFRRVFLQPSASPPCLLKCPGRHLIDEPRHASRLLGHSRHRHLPSSCQSGSLLCLSQPRFLQPSACFGQDIRVAVSPQAGRDQTLRAHLMSSSDPVQHPTGVPLPPSDDLQLHPCGICVDEAGWVRKVLQLGSICSSASLNKHRHRYLDAPGSVRCLQGPEARMEDTCGTPHRLCFGSRVR